MVAPFYYDRVKEYSATTGTGPLTLGGALPSYRPFSIVGNGGRFHYGISNAYDFETGIGSYNATGNLLFRDTVLSSSNSNALVSWPAGNKIVILTLPSRILNGATKGYQIVTATTTLDDTYRVILCNNTTDITLNLPPIAGYDNFSYLIKKVGNNNAKVTLDGNGSELIEDVLTYDLMVVGDYLEICPDGTHWVAINDGIIPHRAKCKRAATQSIAYATNVRIDIDAFYFDVGGIVSLADFGFKIRRPGQYNLLMSMGYASGIPNNSELWIAYKVNGASIVNQWQLMSAGNLSGAASVNLSEMLNLGAGDIVTMIAWQGVGTLSTTNTEQYIPKMSLEEIK